MWYVVIDQVCWNCGVKFDIQSKHHPKSPQFPYRNFCCIECRTEFEKRPNTASSQTMSASPASDGSDNSRRAAE